MAKKLTKEEFVERSKAIHGDKYDYSMVDYVNNRTKVCIICPKHGEFWQTPSDHLLGKGCKRCSVEKNHKLMSGEEWIKLAKKHSSEPYDYSRVEYKGNKKKVEIICPKHGLFHIRPNDFLSGHRCPKCGVENRINKVSTKQCEFIKKLHSVFPEYDTSEVEYVNSHTKVRLCCNRHGWFESLPYHLLSGHGCYKCGQESTHNKQRKSLETFIREAKSVHGDKYDYSNSEYLNRDSKLCIVCPKHGEFWQTPHAHVDLHRGCPICNNSLLEERISRVLDGEGIKFEREKKFNWLRQQRLDFYLPEYNVGIECQGIQHFEPVAYFGGNDGFE